jgi:hypothetical protein
MDEAKIERLERTLWELEQLASELFDMGYITQGNMIYGAVEAVDAELEGIVEGRA